ncbi:hypothetical protein MMC26_006211 [Xylographa opegraphella]|nr:hypothetical protein [Xylographa opegraphella]
MISIYHVGAARYLPLRAISGYPSRQAHASQTAVKGKLYGVSLSYSNSGLVRSEVHTASVNHDLTGPNKSSQKRNPQKHVEARNLTYEPYALTYSEYGSPRVFTSEAFASQEHSGSIEIVKTPIVLLLVTPSLTPFLEIGNQLIPKFIRKTFRRPLQTQEVDVLAAVVDRISFPDESVLKGTGIGQEEARHGSEGISVLIADSQQTAPDLWSPKRSDNCKRNLEEGVPSFLSFQFSSKDALDLSQNIKKPEIIYAVDLPLANTIFHNGKTSTMVAQRWSFNSNTGPSSDLICLKHTLLQQQKICISDAERGSERFIDIPPFCRLTAPRLISESMGNIIRRLRVSHDSATMPASEELEDSLAVWTPDQVNAHEIWARLTPQELCSGLPQIPDNPSEVERGSRLYKVLSGGGGWGNKHGLISLDPSLRSWASSVQSVFRKGKGIETENHDVLGEIARPGDSIQFYAFAKSKTLPPTVFPKAMKLLASPTITIGNIASQQDAMPASTTTENSDPGRLIVYGHFGALSESGIILDIQLCLENATSYGNQAMGTIVQTKLPPHSYFSWRANTISVVPADDGEVTA